MLAVDGAHILGVDHNKHPVTAQCRFGHRARPRAHGFWVPDREGHVIGPFTGREWDVDGASSAHDFQTAMIGSATMYLDRAGPSKGSRRAGVGTYTSRRNQRHRGLFKLRC
ncbi:hypothetical protein IAQ61_000304 [Plenodomus lingam]|uniref:uncharacterized protein n=1 Tax=Leptosphaeria maculans TaxID=5022 RepID=UPI0033259E7E|nr:hypothetical protein IAQ61_000304 [Plenodomus lingam]